MRFSFGTWKGVDQEGQLKTDKMKIEGIFFLVIYCKLTS